VSIKFTMNQVSQGLHTVLGVCFVMVPVACGIPRGKVYGALVGLAFAILKEFWFDPTYEDPETSGGFIGDCEDFSFYVIGILVALAVLQLATLVHLL
jgi:hypothetical protein